MDSSKASIQDSKIIMVISQPADANVMINREISTVNYLMTAFPGHVFLCRGSFLLIELGHPRPASQWAEFYLALLNGCDALYCPDDNRDHPMADWALENEMPIFTDYFDLDLFLAIPVSS